MSKKQMYNVLFCGIGGQGVLTASEVCGWAAIYEGFSAKKSEIHGMAQRGGSVESHLRFGDEVFSPLIPEGEVGFLVSFYKDEHDRMTHLLKKNGVDLIKYLEKAEKEIKDKRLVNTYILGVLSRHLPISEKNWIKAINTVFSRLLDENKEIFLKGRGEK